MSDNSATVPVGTVRKPWWRPQMSVFWLFVVVAVLVIGNQRITLDYYVLAPGGARPVNSAIEIADNRGFPPDGDMLYTTVSLIEAHPFDIVWSQFDSDDEIQPIREIIGDASREEFLESNTLSMEDSQQTAIAVAMRRAGYEVQQNGDGARVQAITENAPATGRLTVGDVVTQVNGQPVLTASDVTGVVSAVSPGAVVTFEMRSSNGETRTVEIATAPRPDAPDRSYIGALLQTENPRLDTPFAVDVDLGKVGGPSAGLAMTLALVDELTDGELTGGTDVAATGTIALDGRVGEVGGVKQKVATVRDDSDARIFLVPTGEAELARGYAGDDLQIVGVDTLDQAIDAIVSAGGQPPRVG